MKSEYKIISKRGTLIPVTFTSPNDRKRYPLVIGFHGYQSSQHEWGLFDECALALMRNGIAMVRIDFPGNGDSEEEFANCTLRNMHDDIDSVLEYLKITVGIEYKQIGIIGYSMGGLTGLTYMERMEKKPEALALWSPGIYMRGFLERNYSDVYGGIRNLMGKGYSEGFVDLIDEWSETKVSYELILDMICENPMQILRNYQGQLLLIGGENDSILNSQDFHMAELVAVNAKKKITLFMENVDHDLGSAWGEQENADINVMNQVITSTVDFFRNIYSLVSEKF